MNQEIAGTHGRERLSAIPAAPLHRLEQVDEHHGRDRVVALGAFDIELGLGSGH